MLKSQVLKLAADSLTGKRFIDRNSKIFNRAKNLDIAMIMLLLITGLGAYFYLDLLKFGFFYILPVCIYFISTSDDDFKNPLIYTNYFESFIVKEMDKKYGINLEGIDFNFMSFYGNPMDIIEKYFDNLDLDEIEMASIYYIEKLRLDPENTSLQRKLNKIVEQIKQRKEISEKKMNHYKKITDLGVNVEYVDTQNLN